MDNVVTSPQTVSPEPSLGHDINTIVAQHERYFGKVSTTTGWRSVLQDRNLFSAETNITGSHLKTRIESAYGPTIANKVDRQLGLSSSNKKLISSYIVTKAVALVEAESDWTKIHQSNFSYCQVDASGNATTSPPTTCHVTLTPLGRLKSLKENKSLFGVSSTDINNRNVVNGWCEEMRIDESTTSTTSLVRSGVLMPPKAKTKDGLQETAKAKTERSDIAMNRYQQILSALVETTSSLIPADFDPTANSKETPLEIEHAHIGLLSTNDPKKPEEAVMATDQMNFIKDQVHEKPIQISYIKKDGTLGTLWVKPIVRYTNFSVQKAQQEETSASAIDTPYTATEATLDHYLGKGNENGVLAKKITNLTEQEEATKLLNELKELRKTRSQEGSSFYSYEFQTKYSLLLAKCGIPTHVYCKSGKDRTSRFSEMIKMWAANPLLKLTNITTAVRKIIEAFSFSGNATIQRLNTGFAGNKQFKTYWRLVAGEKEDLTFGGWTHLASAGSYSGWGASTLVKT